MNTKFCKFPPEIVKAESKSTDRGFELSTHTTISKRHIDSEKTYQISDSDFPIPIKCRLANREF